MAHNMLNKQMSPGYANEKVKKVSSFNENDYWDGLVDAHVNNWLFDLDDFERETPSRNKGISFQDEVNKRVKGVAYIFSCCKQLRLSRSVGLTAAICFHRFYMFEDLVAYHYFEVAATALFVACKSEECRRNLKDVVKVCAKIASGKPDPVDEESKIYWRWKDLLVKLEELLLEKLNFDVTPENPYRLAMEGLKLDATDSAKQTVDKEWEKQATNLFGNCTYMFELFSRLPICLFCSIHSICALAVVLSSKKLQVTFPVDFIKKGFNVEVEDVIQCYNDVISLATEVETLDKYFRILPYIPRTTHKEIELIFNGMKESTLIEA